MAHAGVASRRKCEALITEGRVSVNDKVVNVQGYQVSKGDRIMVDGKPIHLVKKFTYILMNKPRGVVSTVKDNKGRRTVLDLLSDQSNRRLYPVGRLDMDSSGLILLTDDGQLTQRLLHPKYGIEKIYRVTVLGEVTEDDVQQLSQGIKLEDGITTPAEFRVLEYRNKKTRLECKIKEGKNRQIRRMFQALGFKVVQLERVAFGPIKLKGLGKGEYRPLQEKEIRALNHGRIKK